MRHNRKPADSSIEAARIDFRSARFTAAQRRLTQTLEAFPTYVEAALLLARVELRLGDPSNALAVLTRYARTAKGGAKAEAAMLKAVAFARQGDNQSSRAQFRSAEALLDAADPLRNELTYHMAACEWMERRLDRASKLLERIGPNASDDLLLHVAILRGAIASANENLAAQGAILLGELQRVRADGKVEVYLWAMLVTQIAALALELPSGELRNAALAHVDGVPWTEDVSGLHFHATRAIAWRHALEGDEFSAFRRLKEALSAASSDAWRVAALTDRAYLAGALGEPRWSAQELRDAHELASKIDWTGVAGEEKLALPVLAELFATRDPAVAIGYVTTFSNVGRNYPRILSSRRDSRVEALEAYSLGKVQLALGERGEAKRLLGNAFEIYERLGIRWRAARAALALAEIDDADKWRARAQPALEPYPRSWLARAEGRSLHAAIALEPRTGRLTGAQRAVFDLLLEGRGTEDIAKALGRSTFTVRNHLKAIFKAYGVSSRSALIVKATRASSQD